MSVDMTLLELVDAVADDARSDAEVIATVVHMVNSGAVRLCGNFKGARFDLGALEPACQVGRAPACAATCRSTRARRRRSH